MEFRKKSDFDKLAEEMNMTPEQMREAIKSGKDATEKAKALETELNTTKTTLTTMEGSFRETKERLDNIEANSRRQPENNNNNQPQQFTSFIDDEDRAFNERFNRSVTPIAQTALIAARNSAKMAAKLSLQGQTIPTPGGRISLVRLWEKWEREIEEDSKQVAIAALGDMQTWINMFNYVKGKHINELMSEPHTFIESVEERTDKRVKENETKSEDLNSEELATVAKMSKYSKHVSGDSYKATRDKMKFVNG